jgi:hypothetical protein
MRKLLKANKGFNFVVRLSNTPSVPIMANTPSYNLASSIKLQIIEI